MSDFKLSTTFLAFRLPDINGEIEAGIAAGVDASVADQRKLSVWSEQDGADLRHYALASACWAYTNADFATEDVKGHYAVCAFAAIAYELIGDGDGDVKPATTEANYDKATVDAVLALLTEENIRIAVTIMLASKVSWWITNHHTGGTPMSGYALKVATTNLKMDAANQDRITTMFHTVGHWCSTIRCLGILDIRGLRDVKPLYKSKGYKIRMGGDILIRTKTMPAGTHRHGIAYAIVRRMRTHALFPYCPSIDTFGALAVVIKAIKDSPQNFHIGAYYLTGHPRAPFDDNSAADFLGRCASFITGVFSTSTLARSPHISRMDPTTKSPVSKASDYADYHDNWNVLCNQYKTAVKTATKEQVEAVLSKINVVGEAATSESVKNVFDAFTETA
jgi:hypothetical protein